MAMKYMGSLDELKQKVSAINGTWIFDENGKHTFRSEAGGIINWWTSSGTIQFQGQGAAKAVLEQALKNIKPPESTAGECTPTPESSLCRLFLVHGQDRDAGDQLELALHRLLPNTTSIINFSSHDSNIYAALEGASKHDFSADTGIVLMTPDDIGYTITDGPDGAVQRASQGTLLDTGLLLSTLTRERVVIVMKGSIEIPLGLRDIRSFVYNNHVREIVQELHEYLDGKI